MLVSLMAIYGYDDSVLDGLELPTEMDRTTLIKEFLLKDKIEKMEKDNGRED